MGGHGGLNILPQKKWNVYNYDNRMKVQRDKRKAEEKKRNLDDSKIKGLAECRLTMLKM